MPGGIKGEEFNKMVHQWKISTELKKKTGV